MDLNEALEKYMSTKDRESVPPEDFAGPDNSFPIVAGKVGAAWDLAGHADNPDAVRSKIKDIAKRKKLTHELPEDARAETRQEDAKAKDAKDGEDDKKGAVQEPFFIAYSFDIEKTTDTPDGVIIQGYASTRDLDRQKDIVEPTAFSKSLGAYLENPVLLFNHNRDIPIGKVLSAVPDAYGLYTRAHVTEPSYVGKVKRGELKAFSWVGRATRFEPKDKGRVIKEAELLEVSVVTIPANAKAIFTVAKSLDELTPKEEPMNEETQALLKSLSEKVDALTAKVAEPPKAEPGVRKGVVDYKSARHETVAKIMTEADVMKAMSDGHASTVVEKLNKTDDKLTDEEKRLVGAMTRKALLFGMPIVSE